MSAVPVTRALLKNRAPIIDDQYGNRQIVQLSFAIVTHVYTAIKTTGFYQFTMYVRVEHTEIV